AGDCGTAICCSLENTSLSRAAKKKYRALSYAWGDANQPQYVIWINGIPVTVGLQLFGALLHIRRLNRVTSARFWIDAICIQHNNLDEKRTQLPLMREIYSRVTDVWIWLGAATDHTDEAVSYIMQNSPCTLSSSADHLFELAMALLSIICRPWFSGLWVVQELALSRYDPLEIIGTKSIRWSSFARACE
ncbi:heterokaryon incompatibility protein-domain-containing protein, partial [Podospora fimiseda]